MSEKEQPVVDDKVEGLKVKKKPGRPKKLTEQKEPIKLDLTKQKENAVQEQSTEKVVLHSKEEEQEPKVELQEVGSTHEKQETSKQVETKVTSPIVEVVDKEVKQQEKEYKEALRDEKVTGKKLPENIEKLVSFMEETGGNIQDYVRLNRDYTNIDNELLLKEYYKQSKPHLNEDEVHFIIEENFAYDEDVDEPKEIKKKQVAAKEEIAKAKNFLESLKSKYYEEIKLRPNTTQEQKKALEFFNRYNKEQQIATQRHEDFKHATNNYFTNEFEGFEFNVGEKTFRYNVSNVEDVVERQSNLNTFVKKFLNNEGEVVDTVGYHKAIYAAENIDSIASHFYEQGKADAVKDVMAKSKNISNEPRPQQGGDVFINGLKVRAVNGVDSSKLKFKSKKNNNN